MYIYITSKFGFWDEHSNNMKFQVALVIMFKWVIRKPWPTNRIRRRFILRATDRYEAWFFINCFCGKPSLAFLLLCRVFIFLLWVPSNLFLRSFHVRFMDDVTSKCYRVYKIWALHYTLNKIRIHFVNQSYIYIILHRIISTLL